MTPSRCPTASSKKATRPPGQDRASPTPVRWVRDARRRGDAVREGRAVLDGQREEEPPGLGPELRAVPLDERPVALLALGAEVGLAAGVRIL
jgi:hypothetical protein